MYTLANVKEVFIMHCHIVDTIVHERSNSIDLRRPSVETVLFWASLAAFVLALANIFYGMVAGFWPGRDTGFSFLTMIRSTEGIIDLCIYFGSLFNLYYHVKKRMGFFTGRRNFKG